MSKIEVNEIDKQSGSTLTLGGSGTAVTLACGATQTGFGRTGTVNWQTTPKTGDFTAVSGEGYFVNTTSGAVTMTMPSGAAGSIVSIQDYNKTFDTQNFTVAPASGQKINGGDASASLIINTEGQGLTFVYVDGTVGWKTVHENEFTAGGSDFIAATGGTETECGNFKIHSFTGPGTFCVSSAGAPANNSLEYIVVAGGGGSGFCGGNGMGGGGAGGFRFASPTLAPATYPGKPLAAPAGLTAAVQAYPITVGAGGSPGGPSVGGQGGDGANSIFSTITSAGGGKGGKGPISSGAGGPGGSGGGGGGGGFNRVGGTGNTPPVSPAQGTNGGNSTPASPIGPDHASGGGGGAIVAGTNGRPPSNTCQSGPGGDGAGIPTAFGSNGVPCGSFRYYAGGGGGEYYAPVTSSKSTGGKGGGGAGGGPVYDGVTNSGGGGGGGGTPGCKGGGGGSGIVIIRYKFQ